MQWKDVAEKARINLDDLDCLLNGQVNFNVQQRLNVPMRYIEDFINRNSASEVLAELLGGNMTAAESLGKSLDRQGRIGLIVGLLLS